MDLTQLGVSATAVGIVTVLLVQGYKTLAERVAWLPRTNGGATSTLAYMVATLLMWGLSYLGIAPESQADLAGLAQTLLLGAAGWGVSQVGYQASVRTLQSGEGVAE